MTEHWFWLSMIALVFWGITGVTQKLSTNNISAQLSFLGFAISFIPLAIVLQLTLPVAPNIGPAVFLLGALGGLLNGLGVLTSFQAFEKGGKASVVIPIVSMYPLITVIGAYFLFHDHISPANWAGVLLAPVAAWLLSLEG
jgi:bacterial/archaeal transporter family protein